MNDDRGQIATQDDVRVASDSGTFRARWRRWGVCTLLCTALSGAPAFAQTAPPPPPSSTSTVGSSVTNPVTGTATTVTALIVDPDGTPTAGTTAFVQTADGYTFLVKTVGEFIYNDSIHDEQGNPLSLIIVSADTTANTVDVDAPGPEAPVAMNTRMLNAEFEALFSPGEIEPPIIIPDTNDVGASGVRIVRNGSPGGNGHAGALIVPPGDGGDGGRAPAASYPDPSLPTPAAISATNTIGIEVASVGGNGGNGGGSYISPFSGGHGGNGGAGGAVTVTNPTNITVTTVANPGDAQADKDKYGLFAYSRSGVGGNGGIGWLTPGGGGGGGGADGGAVNVTNDATIITTGPGGFGIFALSGSNNAGSGGNQTGIIGGAGSGGGAGKGGPITVTNNGVIQTGTDASGNRTGYQSHGIVAQSIGGAGGSAGAGSNLIASLPASGAAGSDGDKVTITNNGTITTTAEQSRGISAQSIGGGGGSGGSSGGLIALGGTGGAGGKADTVTIVNSATGQITTHAAQSDAVFVQSVGGSGGAGTNAAGALVSIGGAGANAGNGGAVDIQNQGDIVTHGERSRGIVAQSIGGAGGEGGASTSLVAIGGSGAGGGDGGTVSIDNSGSIRTDGDASAGIFAQSIGGGGGNGGNAAGMVAVGGSGDATAKGGIGKAVTIEQSGTIRTLGQNSSGVFAQSIGGGGGSGGSAGAIGVFAGVAIGGKGGQGGAGGDVTVALQGASSTITTGVEQDPLTGTYVRTGGDRSTGIFAQSVGGGGGNGGGALAISGGFGFAASVAVGGQGGNGGAGGKVTLSSGGEGGSEIVTGGDDAIGVFLQSVGGGGGNGGYAFSSAASGGLLSGSLSVAVGGGGGTASRGGTVEIGQFTPLAANPDDALDREYAFVDSGFGGSIRTFGERSTGFFAQSVGGGGGNGGLAVSAAASASLLVGGSISVGVGGSGGGGGEGGTVLAGTSGDITTEGAHSTGMLVQSVGGGGGNGGGTVAASVAASGLGSGSISVGVGGKGGSGGAGGSVAAATRDGTVTTRGENASGIVVQSVGGGGGNGGYTVAVGAALAGVGAGAVSVGLGGSGGSGGDGRTVTADLQSDVLTQGMSSTGVVVQSVGGGGGNGGFNIAAGGAGAGVGSGAVSVGLGGAGGVGGDAGVVKATSTGSITTEGDRSSGFVVQSVGGGGGNGGFNVSGTIAGAGVGSGAVSVGLGGAGGAGGLAGAVTASNTGDVRTKGESSTAILAQSVGGGGGNGGFNVDVSIAGAGVGSGAIGVGLGGTGGAGSHGSSVTLTVGSEGDGADVITEGRNSTGVIAQSIGGGGGNGGFNVTVAGAVAGVGSGAVGVGLGGSGAGGGTAGTVHSTVYGNILTGGFEADPVTGEFRRSDRENSAGLLVQSVGGGGGNGGFNVTAALGAAGVGTGAVAVGFGGSAGTGGNGGVVTSSFTGNVGTAGDVGTGVTVQSLGGGGGNGGINVSGTVTASGTGAGGIAVGFGGSGGTGGTAKDVTSTVTGEVTTLGLESTGVVAQSLGGGGGNGGLNVSGTVTLSGSGSGGVAVGLGGSGGGGGGAGAVISTVTGKVATAGAQASGVLAQSLGGGGGNGGLNVSGAVNASGGVGGAVAVGLGGSGGGGGNASTVDATVTGDVTTRGDGAEGIVAQSLGGGGGNGGLNVSGSVNLSGQEGGAVGVGIGGSGGSGGNAERSTLTVTGDVDTYGASDAGGVLSQSVGGGGGNGGLNVTGAISLTGNTGGAVAVGIGGSGGSGGIGREANATLAGDVTTRGTGSNAFTAQSIGGGGGNGGLNVSGSIAASMAGAANVGVGIGGAGGGGGAAGAANGALTGVATTMGDDSHGVFIQSVGGGGGSGGLNVTGVITASKAGAGSIGVGIGGFGGGGGAAGAVQGTVTGGASTAGDRSHGVFLQSIGGGGGAGGLNVSGGVSLAKSASGAATVGIGGFGGDGGNASTVTGRVTGDVTTTGSKSIGVLTQSVGGGGGNGGLNVSGTVQLTSEGNATGAIGIGGFGGGGGTAAEVTLTRTGVTRTDGADSDGIVAQSIGGGGGSGGLNVSGAISGSSSSSAFTGTFGLGGFGGGGGNAGVVTANVTGDVIATGLASDEYVDEDGLTRRVRAGGSNGVLAQSVGGSGGNGGLNVSGGIALAKPKSGSNALNIGIGGFGGSGGDAATVTLTVDADTVTAVGDRRFGIGAQSVGGGGGNGGLNVSAGIVMDGQITAGVGGFGGDGGIGGTVTATADTNIFASGAGAIGFMAQSIGGGGGNGGLNVSGGISAGTQSEKASLVFGIGGFGGAGNSSSTVTATQKGSITVEGADSIGVLAQSVAGGGGNGGLNVSGNIALGKGYAASIGIGGNGGLGADAGAVTLISDGEIRVDGREPGDPAAPTAPEDRSKLDYRERANGILAQSIGGGGGNGGMNVTGAFARAGSPLAVGVGGSGDGGGNAGAVTVRRGLEEASLLVTRGNGANALTAQSIGGGGGNAGMNIVVEGTIQATEEDKRKQMKIVIGGGGGAPGHGEAVNVTHVGDIVTQGRQSDGILAQSIGGGGGNANVNLGMGLNRKTSGFDFVLGGAPGEGGDGRAVTVDHTGTIVTLGNDATAIFAQSIGGGGGNAEADDSQVQDILTAPEIALDVFSDEKRSVNLTIGRQGGTGGEGSSVAVTSDGTISTYGDRAVGIRAQSVGNAGGVSGTSSFAWSGDNDLSVQLGREGGAGGRANEVSVNASGFITTRGADAHAIHAQSVGGGGGVGGAVTSELLQTKSSSLSVGLGGEGGTGAVGGTVSVVNSADLTTLGAGAHGIYVQSIGGGGGDGGYAGATASEVISAAAEALKEKLKNEEDKGSTKVSALVGGTGGTGATGDDVDVLNRGTILTAGAKAHGINAQSIGGGGGEGGMVLTGNIAAGKDRNAFTLNVGGSGGDGALGGDVAVVNEGAIQATGSESIGIRAQSVGGGGGDAGLVANLNISAVGKDSSTKAIGVNIGGSGGTGAAAGNVAVTNRRAGDGTGGSVLTTGASGHGIFAQSLGGGGGNGSSIISANFAAGGKDSAQVGMSVGGSGGSGGTAGNVSVINGAQIETRGAGAHGVFAQSIGGGGGNGGLAFAANAVFASGADAATGAATPLVAVGGAGGEGENAGSVTVDNSGTIVTRGKGAHGVHAQSIGGGGGNAGIGIGLTNDLTSTLIAGTLSAILGGRGGEGGEGGQVTVRHFGDITVLGDGSRAVVAESINGGGGGVALDFNGITSLPGGEALPGAPAGRETQPVFVLGGGATDARNSDAGRVTLDYTGTFGVSGDNGAGNAVQAIGGGGGTFDVVLGVLDAATNSGDRIELQGRLGGTRGENNDGGEVRSRHAGDLVTLGTNTPGLFVQSIGGGGGRASIDVTSESGAFGASAFALGGEDGTSENGGSISHEQSGSIATSGDVAHGAILQSIGGGGGLMSLVVEGGASATGPAAVQSATAGDAVTPATLTLGSRGGTELDGDGVELELTGDLATNGRNSAGLVLQSLGGGGGTASVLGADSLDVMLGGSHGASGDGGALALTNIGDVSTRGARSHGVVLQSIGGGGAAVFTDVATPNVNVSSENQGNGGAIRFIQIGDIVTQGAESIGLLTQSLGGGGGFVDGAFADSAGGAGAGGAIALTLAGDVVSMGGRSTGLFLQSAGRTGAGNIRASLADGHRIVGGVDGTGVVLDGGARNRFENHGSIMTLSGATGLAFKGGDGDDVIVNHGVMLGNIDLGGGDNSLTNHSDATLYSGAVLNLGAADSSLTQGGLLAPGAGDLAVVTNLNGSLRQLANARSELELDFASGTVDSVLATGTVAAAGTAEVSLINTHAAKPGTYTNVLYRGAQGLTNDGLMLVAQPSIVVGYDLSFQDPLSAALRYQVDFAPSALSGNRREIGQYVNRVQAAGGNSAFDATISALVQQTDLGAYSNLLTQLGAEFYAEQQVYTLESVQRFTRVMQNCGALNLGGIAGREGGCGWARFDRDSSNRAADALGFPAGEQATRRYSQGFQYTPEGPWTYGLGMAFEDSDSNGFGHTWSGDAKTLQFGFLGRRAFGRTSTGAMVTLGNSNQNVRRSFFGTDQVYASGKRDVSFASGVFDVTHHLRRNRLSITPSLNLGVLALRGESLNENGAGAPSASIASGSDTHAWLEPAIGFGYETALLGRRLLRAYARLGVVQLLTDAESRVRAGFAAAPAGVEPMQIVSDLDRTQFIAEGGFEFLASDRLTLALSYATQDSDLRDTGTGTLRIWFPIH